MDFCPTSRNDRLRASSQKMNETILDQCRSHFVGGHQLRPGRVCCKRMWIDKLCVLKVTNRGSAWTVPGWRSLPTHRESLLYVSTQLQHSMAFNSETTVTGWVGQGPCYPSSICGSFHNIEEPEARF
nr:hypothetical protein CFP56_13209 [Quercus suber]